MYKDYVKLDRGMSSHKSGVPILVTILVVSQLYPSYMFCSFAKLHRIVPLNREQLKLSYYHSNVRSTEIIHKQTIEVVEVYIDNCSDVYINLYFHVLFCIFRYNVGKPLLEKVQQLYIVRFVVRSLKEM